jgi:hypothetical protein
MKKIITLLFMLLLLGGCISQSSKRMHPYIDEFEAAKLKAPASAIMNK